jgi:hypothetical protein
MKRIWKPLLVIVDMHLGSTRIQAIAPFTYRLQTQSGEPPPNKPEVYPWK